MRCSAVTSLKEVSAEDWNRLSGSDNPFVRHEFLIALERNGCVGDDAGWAPQHLLLHDGPRLVGALPMYLKHHSYGEYVFDWGWADAYRRCGLPYYPKLVSAIPYTPVTGPRLLSDPGGDSGEIRGSLIEAALAHARAEDVSSVHWLFTTPSETQSLCDERLVHRTGCQFHWTNPGFQSFEDFLLALTSKKRKQIKRERRQARDAGLDVHIYSGEALGRPQWEAFYAFYCATYDRKWGMPYLTLSFFEEIGRTLPDSVLLILASRGDEYVAGALALRGRDTLYGRNWGCHEYHPALHYEMCYYRTIDYCIEKGLKRFEAGAQGEYKLSRGLLPVATRSVHWVRHPQFRSAIAAFVEEERRDLMRYIDYMDRHSPFKAGSAPPTLDTLAG